LNSFAKRKKEIGILEDLSWRRRLAKGRRAIANASFQGLSYPLAQEIQAGLTLKHLPL
jgi:hypothetical protein